MRSAGERGWRLGVNTVECVKADVCVIFPSLEAAGSQQAESRRGDVSTKDGTQPTRGIGIVHVMVPPLFVAQEEEWPHSQSHTNLVRRLSPTPSLSLAA